MKEAEKYHYKPTRFMLPTSHYDKNRADRAVLFIQSLKHTKGIWAGKPFFLFPWQEQIIRDLFGVIKENGYRQFNTAYIEIGKKNGKSELAAAVALYMLCADNEEGAEIYGCANDRAQASIVFDVARDMVIPSCAGAWTMCMYAPILPETSSQTRKSQPRKSTAWWPW